MSEGLSERQRNQGYLFAILIASIGMRILVGLFRPTLGLEQSLLIGLTAVVFLAPSLYRFFHGQELLDSKRKRASHGLSMALSAGLFLYYVALGLT
jgi:hypothetical protein